MKIYDEIDMRNARSAGYWLGSVCTFVGTLVLFALVGLYLHS